VLRLRHERNCSIGKREAAELLVTAGLVPAISIMRGRAAPIQVPASQASEATPFFERLWPVTPRQAI
jgi:hypothetical protein